MGGEKQENVPRVREGVAGGVKGRGRFDAQGQKSPTEQEETGPRGDMEEGGMVGGMTKIRSWR